MRRSDHRTLIDMGRKAGLKTSELYGALAGRRPMAREAQVGDGNGVRPSYDAAGHLVFQPESGGRT